MKELLGANPFLLQKREKEKAFCGAIVYAEMDSFYFP